MDRREVCLCEGALDGVRVGFERLRKKKGLSSYSLLNPLSLGGPSATRTRDQLVKSQLLYQLS